MHRYVQRLIVVCLLGIPPGAGTAAAGDSDPEAALAALRSRIAEVQAELEAQTARRDQEQVRLRGLEKDVAETAAALATTREALTASRERRRELLARKSVHEGRLADQRGMLAEQIRAAYLGGRQERLRLALNQQDPARLGRMLVYYRYLSAARAERIDAVTAELERLAAVEAELDQANRRLETLTARREEALDALRSARDRRRSLVAGIDARLRAGGDRLSRLREEESALQRLIEELRQALANLPGTRREPFADQRGRLQWPTRGRLLSDFGQPRAGGSLRWNGLLIGTERGAAVSAVYHGRIAYADWLPGLGLLVVIEHSDGYLSLYGHNEVLYRQVGEWVEPGDQIAAAGDSGGRSRAALYFEIRKGAEPINPHRWLRGRLAAR